MMRSMYSGVSGLKTHQTKMDVIGNNIANVNTVAYKSSSVTFQDLMYQTTQSASGADSSTNRGGINATQVGLGVKLGSIYTDVGSQGSLQATNDTFDMAITGSNFFVVNNGTQNCYTRAGSFYVDGSGNLAMKTTGYLVQGWVADDDGVLGQEVTSLPIMTASNQTSEPEGTTEATVKGILDKNSSDLDPDNGAGRLISTQIYDSLGYSYTVQMKIKANADSKDTGAYSLQFYNIVDSEGNSVPTSQFYVADNANGATGVTLKQPLLTSGVMQSQNNANDPKFTMTLTGSNGSYTVSDGRTGKDKTFSNAEEAAAYFTELTGETATAGGTQDNVTYNASITYYYPSTTIQFDTASGALVGITQIDASNNPYTTKDITLNLDGNDSGNTAAGSVNFKDLHIDFSSAQWLNNNKINTIDGKAGGTVDGTANMGAGKKVGTMIGLSVDTAGRIYASYSNGNTKLLAQVATAEFANVSGLLKTGENLYDESLNSGTATVESVAANGGSISSGYLELSNVDLATEFTEMITTQRGYQANSRIITTSDSMLEELVNLKR